MRTIIPQDLPPGTEIHFDQSGILLLHSWRNERGLHIVRCAIGQAWYQEEGHAQDLVETLTDFWLAVGLEIMSEQALDQET